MNKETSNPLMAIEQNAEKSLLDALYCEEEKWVDVDDEDEDENESEITFTHSTNTTPPVLSEQDFFWEDQELQSLFSKETQTFPTSIHNQTIASSRKESVEWILKINAYYGFSCLTPILAVNYLDRFLSSLSFPLPEEKPWMMQLAAVTCLSLAAKVEETHVPLLLDLQVEGTEYVFEAKTIQRMELLVLPSLKWRMNPVTPISFLDHIIRRLGLKSYAHWEFFTTCENLLLSVVSDPRFTLYLPSVLATATMLHVIHRFEPPNALEYENQLLSVLKINKEEMKECYDFIREVYSNTGLDGYNNGLKRKICQVPGSPDGAVLSWNDDSLGVVVGSPVSGPHEPIFKKTRTTLLHQHQMRLPSFTTTSVFVGSPH